MTKRRSHPYAFDSKRRKFVSIGRAPVRLPKRGGRPLKDGILGGLTESCSWLTKLKRNATFDEFLAASALSDTEDFLAHLHYLDFARLSADERARQEK